MRELAQLLNEMCAGGTILNYALFGALAQMRYTEPVATLDANVLLPYPHPTGSTCSATSTSFVQRGAFTRREKPFKSVPGRPNSYRCSAH